MSVADVILSKFIFPTHLDSVEIREQVAEAIRQRAFYSARMACKSYLEQLQRVCAAYAKGDINAADARARAQSVLDSLGLSDPASYKMVDPGSTQRLNLILKTQRAMAASVARLDRQTLAILDQWPAWRLERYGSRSAPRQDWPARWKAAGDAVGWQGASKREMVALKTSPIWKALGQGAGGFHDALGNPYPPFAYSSGLGWSDVTREEAERLGILEDAPLGPPPRASLTPTEQEIADAMAGLRTFNKQCPDCGRFIGKPQHDCKGGSKEKAPPLTPEKKKQILQGYKGKCSQQEAMRLLDDGIQMSDASHNIVRFTRFVKVHYEKGERRKGNTPKRENLEDLPTAILAIRMMPFTLKFPKGTTPDYINPPRGTQRVYSIDLGKKRLKVFVYHDSGIVSGWHKPD
jgi:hypothetical protein